MPHSLRVLARLPRIDLRDAPMDFPENEASGVSAELPVVGESVGVPVDPPATISYRIDSAHQTTGHRQAIETPSPDSYQRPVESDPTSPEHDSSQHDSEDRVEEERTMWPRHRSARKAAIMSAAVAIVLTPLYFIFGGAATQTAEPETAPWPTRSLHVGADEDHDHDHSSHQKSPRVAEDPKGRSYAPKFPRLPHSQAQGDGSQGGAEEDASSSRDGGVIEREPGSDEKKQGANRFAEGDKSQTPKTPRVRLGKNIEAAGGDVDERKRSGIYR